MSTFYLKNPKPEYTILSNIFIDKYMPKARGEFVKVYLLLLKYASIGEYRLNSLKIAASLNLLETEFMQALEYWDKNGVIKYSSTEKSYEFCIELLDLSLSSIAESNSFDILESLEMNKPMIKDIEALINRPISSRELEMYLSWIEDFHFQPELVIFLIEYCVAQGKYNIKYIEAVAMNWHTAGIRNTTDANAEIKKFEKKQQQMREILNYIGMKSDTIIKPVEEFLERWLVTYNFSVEIIKKACDIALYNTNATDLSYINTVLSNWNTKGLKSLAAIEAANREFKKNNKKTPVKQTVSKKPSTFSDYTQRDIDFAALENDLNGW